MHLQPTVARVCKGRLKRGSTFLRIMRSKSLAIGAKANFDATDILLRFSGLVFILVVKGSSRGAT